MDDNTIHKFNCRICGQYSEIQSVYDLLDNLCSKCWLKENKKRD